MTRTSGFESGAYRDSHDGPVLITEAQQSVEDQHKARVRKYMFIMSFRIPALVLAAISYSMWMNPWIAMAIVGVSIPLPWMAVLIANDRPPRTKDEMSRYDYRTVEHAQLESRDHHVIEQRDD